jgi:hypothetical protein
MGSPISGKSSSFYPDLTSGHVFLVVAFIDKILYGVNTVLGKGCVGWEHWISSTKLLKLAQIYPVYCTVVLMAVIILGNLLIRKVFAMNILNNNKYSGHHTLCWVFFKRCRN